MTTCTRITFRRGADVDSDVAGAEVVSNKDADADVDVVDSTPTEVRIATRMVIATTLVQNATPPQPIIKRQKLLQT